MAKDNMAVANDKSEVNFRKSLEAFVVDNADLERLEFLLTQFNIFEAIGMVRQEERHSHFLAYLLNPQQNHGLRDVFVKKLLKQVVSVGDGFQFPVSPIDLDTWNLEQSEVSTEWQNIDILLTDERNNLIVAIENKIGTSEHSNQLERYWQVLQKHFPGKRILGMYLSPDGEKPSHANFYSVGYARIASIIEGLSESSGVGLAADVRATMLHYAQMLRRRIVSESEIAELCRRIYRKHKDALDLIDEYKPDQQATIQSFLDGLIESAPELILDFSSKRYIRFSLKNWARLPSGQGWTASGRMLLFEFQNLPDSLKLKLVIGPGPLDVREKLFRLALDNQPPFKPQSKSLNKQWNEIFARTFLSAISYEKTTDDELQRKIREQWEHFMESDLPMTTKLVEGAV
ncbi:MAG: PD-(D/E)XK nuclease family protein [Candidatus Acidiferrales bacterium]